MSCTLCPHSRSSGFLHDEAHFMCNRAQSGVAVVVSGGCQRSSSLHDRQAGFNLCARTAKRAEKIDLPKDHSWGKSDLRQSRTELVPNASASHSSSPKAAIALLGSKTWMGCPMFCDIIFLDGDANCDRVLRYCDASSFMVLCSVAEGPELVSRHCTSLGLSSRCQALIHQSIS
jgi:hypothetical protein